MLNIKYFDEEYKEFKRLKRVLYDAYKRHPDTLTGDTLEKYDVFVELYDTMKQRYHTKIINEGFIKWLDDIEEFNP